jgi:putative oxidoreductase
MNLSCTDVSVLEVPVELLVPVARVLFAALFVHAGLKHLSPSDPAIGYAGAMGVPAPHVTVKLAGILAVAGGLSVALGVYAQIGALLLVAFLLPVTVMLHRFWGLSDPQAAAMQRIQFEKNVALMGGALLVAGFGSGPLSLQ